MIRSVFASRNQSRLAVALAVSLLAACSGGGGTPSTSQIPSVLPTAPAVQPTAGTQSASKAGVQFSITVPHAVSTASSLIRPKYVSPNTGSVRISILSADSVAVHVPDTVVPIAYGAPGCASKSSQPLTCSISVTAPTGNAVAFTLSTYQSNNGSGAVLSTGTVSVPVTAGKTNAVPIALGGVATSIAMSPKTLPLVQDGQLHIFHLTVNAIDASGATIIDSTPLANPVALSISGDTKSALQLSTANLTTPGQPVQLTYDGKIALNSATISASAGSFTTSLSVAPLQVSPTSVKMQNGKTVSITVHESGFAGQFTATLADTTLAQTSISATSSGTATITATGETSGQGASTLTIGDGTVSVSVPLLVAPVIFNYFSAGLQKYSQLNFITNGPNGKLVFADQGLSAGAVGIFDPSTGVSREYRTGLGPNDTPDMIAMGPDGNAYFTDFNSSSPAIGQMNPSTGAIALFPVPANLTTAMTAGPDHNIWYTDANFGAFQFGVFNPATQQATEYPFPSTSSVQCMTTGPDGRVWFCDWGTHAIGVIDPTTHVVTEYTTGMQSFALPQTITTGPDGNLWFTDHRFSHFMVGKIVPSTGAITEYPISLPGSSSQPFGIVSARGKLWITGPNPFAAFGGGGSSIGSVDPATGQFTDYSFGIGTASSPYSVVLGPDNELWFGDVGQIGQAIIP